MIKKVLITGVAGFLGSHLADALIKKNLKVVGIDNLRGGYKDNIPKKVEFHKIDCVDLKKVNKVMKNIDVVYHCAAAAYEGLSVFAPNDICKNIFQSSVSIFASAIENNVKRIIFCSSMARYGNQKTPFRENMDTNAVDPYGIAKVAAENVLKNLCEINNVEWVIVVPHNIIGPRQKYDDPYRNVVSIMLNRMLLGKSPIIFGDGNQKRCFSYIDDCIYCLEKVLNSKSTNKQIINIGPDEEFVTINKIAEICSNVTGSNLEPIYTGERPQEVKLATCSSDKARKLLNYKTSTDLYTAIEKTYEYIRKRGKKDFDYSKFELEINNKLTPKVWKNKEI